MKTDVLVGDSGETSNFLNVVGGREGSDFLKMNHSGNNCFFSFHYNSLRQKFLDTIQLFVLKAEISELFDQFTRFFRTL